MQEGGKVKVSKNVLPSHRTNQTRNEEFRSGLKSTFPLAGSDTWAMLGVGFLDFTLAPKVFIHRCFVTNKIIQKCNRLYKSNF